MGAPLVIRVAGRSSRVVVSAAPATDMSVGDASMRQSPDGSFDVSATNGKKIEITCPEHSSVTISTSSGSVSVEGALAAVQVVTSSGRVEVEQASDLEVRTASGRVDVGRCQQSCRVTTQSGRIDVGSAAGVELCSSTGRVSVGEAEHAVVRTVSGRIEVGATAAADVEAHSISGKVEVRVAGASPARMQLSTRSGRIERHLPEGDGGARIEVTTTSGSIAIDRR